MIYNGIYEIQFIHQNKITFLKRRLPIILCVTFSTKLIWNGKTAKLKHLFHSRNDTSIGKLNFCNGTYQILSTMLMTKIDL